MKKQILLLAMMLLPMVAGAETVEIDGIYYELVSKIKQAEVTSNPNGYYSGSITIPSTITYEGEEYVVTRIGKEAFKDSSLKFIIIPNGVTSIGEEAFFNCKRLDSVTIPNSVTSIEYGAFYGCSGLLSVIISNSITTIEQQVFSNCTGLTSITIPNGVASIGVSAFYGCTGLVSVDIPNSVIDIGQSAFNRCSGLTSLTIPNNVNSIGRSAFYGCSSLTTVIIPNSVTKVVENAFTNCSGLISLTIGSRTRIGSQAFSSCKELVNVYCLSEHVPVMETYFGKRVTDAFQDSYIEYATLHVPAESLEEYRAAEPWKNFKSIVALNEEDILNPQKCANPTIAYEDGKLLFECETEGAEFAYEIKNTDSKKGSGGEVDIKPQVTTVTVYAMKTGCDNSDVATATIRWRDGRPLFEGFSRVVVNDQETSDANGDGTVDVADIATIISTMAGK